MMKKKTSSLTLAFIYVLLTSCGGTANEEQKQDPLSHTNATNTAATSTAARESAQTPSASQHQTADGPATSIPDFKFYILKNGISFNNSDLKSEKTHVFVLFDPSCGHCQHEARDIGKNFSSFKNTEFYFISMNDPALMSTFFKTYAPELENKDNVHLLYDKDMQFVYKFHIPKQYPATYIYRPDGSLKGFWNGEKKPEEIIQSINL